MVAHYPELSILELVEKPAPGCPWRVTADGGSRDIQETQACRHFPRMIDRIREEQNLFGLTVTYGLDQHEIPALVQGKLAVDAFKHPVHTELITADNH